MLTREQRKILSEIRRHTEHSISVCSDPMNGCPEDFAESFGRQEDKLIMQAYKTGIDDDNIQKARKKGADDANFNEARIYDNKFRGFRGVIRWKIQGIVREYERNELVVSDNIKGKIKRMHVTKFLRKFGW